MNKEFVPYEEALALKELGFNEPCIGFYEKDNLDIIPNKQYLSKLSYIQNDVIHIDLSCSCPTYSSVFRWFREKYDYDISIKKCTPSEYKFVIEKLSTKKDSYYFLGVIFKSYGEAELACLKKLIELIKNK